MAIIRINSSGFAVGYYYNHNGIKTPYQKQFDTPDNAIWFLMEWRDTSDVEFSIVRENNAWYNMLKDAEK